MSEENQTTDHGPQTTDQPSAEAMATCREVSNCTEPGCKRCVATARIVDRHFAELRRLAEIGKRWEADSSLGKWFPFTAEELANARNELEARRVDCAQWQRVIDLVVEQCGDAGQTLFGSEADHAEHLVGWLCGRVKALTEENAALKTFGGD